jgi:hypothetical protein
MDTQGQAAGLAMLDAIADAIQQDPIAPRMPEAGRDQDDLQGAICFGRPALSRAARIPSMVPFRWFGMVTARQAADGLHGSERSFIMKGNRRMGRGGFRLVCR